MEEPMTQEQLEQDRSRAENLVQLAVRAVSAELAGQPVDRVFRVLNARLHSGGVARDSEELWEYAESISSGTPPDLDAGRI